MNPLMEFSRGESLEEQVGIRPELAVVAADSYPVAEGPAVENDHLLQESCIAYQQISAEGRRFALGHISPNQHLEEDCLQGYGQIQGETLLADSEHGGRSSQFLSGVELLDL